MGQVDLDRSVGYALKRAVTTLHGALEAELRGHGLSLPQYACLELLAQRPGLSNAELARGAFVTRQAMHQLLASLLASGLVTSQGTGRARRLQLTAEGQRRLRGPSLAVAAIEERMLAGLSPHQRENLRQDLITCAEALREPERRHA